MKKKAKRKTARAHISPIRAAGRSLVFALLLALPWAAPHAAFALTAPDQSPADANPVYHVGESFNPVGSSGLPFTMIDERPDPKAATAGAASQIWGSQLSLALNVNSSLASSVYYSKSLPLYEALRRNSQFGGFDPTLGVLAFRAEGAEHVLDSGRAIQQKLDYASGAFALQGSYTDVDKDFHTPGAGSVSVIGDRSPVDALAAMRGMSELQFQAQFNPSAAFALSTSQRKSVNEQPGHKEIGMTVSEMAHALTYQLSGDRQLKADFQSRDEDWRGHGAINMEKLAAHLDVTSRLALDYSYDWNKNERQGHKEKGRDVTEIKQSLVYKLTGDSKLALDYRKFDEQWDGKGPMQLETLAASLNPTSRLQLTYNHDWSANDRDGHKEKGLTRDATKTGLAYQLTDQTRLEVNYDDIREEWDRGDRTDATETQIRNYAVRHAFGGSTKADVTRNLTSITSAGATTDIDTTQLHLEHKPGERLNLVADWMDRNRSDGGTEDLTALALDTAIGSGAGKTAIKALYQQHSDGADDKQVDTLYRLGVSASPSPLLQLRADYESLNQQGPKADHDFVRTNLGFASQLHRYAKLTADYARETDKDVQTKSDRGARIEINPGWLTLSGGVAFQERQGQPDLTTTSGDLQIKFGHALADWAKAVSGAEPLPGAGAHGFRGAPGWLNLGDGAITLNYIARSTDEQSHVVTRSLGYQTMLGDRAYVKLAMHKNPMIKKKDKLVMEAARWDSYEGGLDLSSGFAALGRFIREEDLNSGRAATARVLGLRGAIGGSDTFTFVGGLQTVQPEGDAATNWQFANVNLKFGRALADWAKAASDGGLFDDNTKYGHRKLPGWAAFADGGLSLQYMSRESETGDQLIASAAGYQTMLGDRAYVKLSFQQNPLTDKGKVIPVDRKLYEVGRRFGGKFMALARFITDDNLAESKSLRTSMLGLRSRLSERERLETVIVLDDVSSQGQRYRSTTYGLEYAREVNDGHYLIVKGTLTRDDRPGVSDELRDNYQVDFAYKKAI
ncbi:MAG: hypothetical protein JSV65_09655 [Armatimonadota bacterium]|nr:MAG: hypothetical protein JSV65_09655 [Armatimonadota bacterium]